MEYFSINVNFVALALICGPCQALSTKYHILAEKIGKELKLILAVWLRISVPLQLPNLNRPI